MGSWFCGAAQASYATEKSWSFIVVIRWKAWNLLIKWKIFLYWQIVLSYLCHNLHACSLCVTLYIWHFVWCMIVIEFQWIMSWKSLNPVKARVYEPLMFGYLNAAHAAMRYVTASVMWIFCHFSEMLTCVQTDWAIYKLDSKRSNYCRAEKPHA